ncbi:MAG: flavodoxin family protein [Candidatus Rifleibacteriota bacterium]
MKVLAILGSPRKNGNSGFLAETFVEQAKKKGADTCSFYLEGMSYKGCKACGACKKGSDRCVIKDDLTEVLDEMHAADVIIYAVPNYFADLSGQFKLFLDRTYSLLTPQFMEGENRSRLSAGKHLVFIFTQGAPEQAFKDIPEKYSHLKDYFNFASFNVIRGCGLFAPDQAKGRTDLIEQVEKLAEKLIN